MADKYGIEGMAWMKKKRFIESKVNQLKEGGQNIAKEAARRAGVETYKATQKIGNKAVKLAQDPKVLQARQVIDDTVRQVQEGGKNAKTLLTEEMKKKNKLQRLGRLGDHAIEQGKVKAQKIKSSVKSRGGGGSPAGPGKFSILDRLKQRSPWAWLSKKTF